jgi:IS30 family transposase
MESISQRPPEVADRAVPGHWEGDLLVGKPNRSFIATLVERHTRFVLLGYLGRDAKTETVTAKLAELITRLPEQLRRSLTWDQGREMARHRQFTISTGVPVYFCDPHSPWQRGSNENTNGLLRQVLPQGHRSRHPPPGRPRSRGCRTQRPAPADARLAHTSCEDGRAVAMIA